MQFEHYEPVSFFLTEQIIKASRVANKIRRSSIAIYCSANG